MSLGGCQKEFTITFVNTTGLERDIRLCSSEHGVMDLGDVMPTNGTAKADLKFTKLPAVLFWRSGDLNGMLAVDWNTDSCITKFIADDEWPATHCDKPQAGQTNSPAIDSQDASQGQAPEPPNLQARS